MVAIDIKNEEQRLKDAQKILSKLLEQEKLYKQKQAEADKQKKKLDDMKNEYFKLTRIENDETRIYNS
jgi:CRISPR/Cas system-associated endoribonuclease Cas2